MKLSASDAYPGHCAEAMSDWKCLLNGVEITNVVYADEELCMVVQLALDNAGKIKLPVKEVQRFGIVRLSLPSDPDLEQRLRDEQRAASSR